MNCVGTRCKSSGEDGTYAVVVRGDDEDTKVFPSDGDLDRHTVGFLAILSSSCDLAASGTLLTQILPMSI